MAPMQWGNSMMCAKIQSKPFTSCESHLSSVYQYYILDSNQKWRKYLSNSFKVLLNTFCLRLNRYKCYHAFSNIIIKLLTNEYVNMYLGQALFPLKSLLVVCCPPGVKGQRFYRWFFLCVRYIDKIRVFIVDYNSFTFVFPGNSFVWMTTLNMKVKRPKP